MTGRKGARIKNAEDVTYNSWKWDLLQSTRDSADSIFACKFSPNGSQFVAASKDWTVCVYNYPDAGVRWGMEPAKMKMEQDAHFQRLQSSEIAGDAYVPRTYPYHYLEMLVQY